MEAWRPADKSNLDWAHPWCASPSFTIPGSVLGVWPLSPGWARWRVAPQPSVLDYATADVPTPAGILHVAYAGVVNSAGSNSTVTLNSLQGQAVQACLCVPGNASTSAAVLAAASSDILYVDGVAGPTSPWGRLSCTAQDLGPGLHVISRITVV